MDERDLAKTVAHINRQIHGILRSQRILARIHEQLKERDRNALEEDYIDAAINDRAIGIPTIRRFDGITVEVRKLHRRGLNAADIAGADALYEIVGKKFIVIQYKRANQ